MTKMPLWLKLTAGFIVLVVGFVLLRPAPIDVEVGTVEMRPFFEAIEEQGRTRARNPFLITAPVSGRLLRTSLDEGDRINSGEVIAVIAPAPQDQRSSAFAQANLAAAEARLAVANASLRETMSAYERVTREKERREELFERSLASAEETEQYRQLSAAEEARVQSAHASVMAAQADIESARALLLGADPDDQVSDQAVIEIKAPVAGTVHRVLEENERVVQAGTPLLNLSNQDSLEIVVDLLTQDAVKVEAGDTVYISGWGGDRTLNAFVRSIEPEAYTKVSALGVDEQRVNVIIDLIDPPPNLGAEYRVEVAIVTWQANSTLTIPTSAVFQRSSGWHTFVVEDNRVELKPIMIGARDQERTRVLGGVSEDDQVILYPSDLINEGSSVRF
ncbi:MAG: efflux RND transporter periplasmic adaptor subunit [Pseudomonadales bacterium]|nr:efflux RND transporter periplasmic adaptor subunit [Pseudomonadales bacterium]